MDAGDARQLPGDVVAALEAEIRAIHALLGAPAPGADELARGVAAAAGRGMSGEELRALAAAGRLREVTDTRPFNLEMDIVNQCNLRCVMCMMSHPTMLAQRRQRFGIERFERLSRRAASLPT